MIRRVFSLFVGIAALAFSATGGERAQTSGARKTGEEEKKSAPTAQTEAERFGTMNKLLRNRQFDVFRSGNSLGGAIDIPLPAPSASMPAIDPKTQKRLLDEYDRKKNWLAEPGATTPREMEVPTDSDGIPDFSRDRDRSRSARDADTDETEFAEATGRGRKSKESQLNENGSADDRRFHIRGEDKENQSTGPDEWDSRSGLSGLPSQRRDEQNATADRDSMLERVVGTFDLGQNPRQDFGFRPTDRDQSFGTRTLAKEYLDPLADPSAMRSLADPFSDPGRKFDPTSLPQTPFAPRDDGMLPKTDSFSAAGAPASGFNSFGADTTATGGGINTFFTAPAAPAPVHLPATPAFTPRPAVLSFPLPGSF